MTPEQKKELIEFLNDLKVIFGEQWVKDGANQLIAALESDNDSCEGWIDGNIYPDKEGFYFCYGSLGREIRYFENSGWVGLSSNDYISYWRPLPEPPKEPKQ